MNAPTDNFDFQRRARQEMLREGFQPDFPPPVMAETNSFHPAPQEGGGRDLRDLLWSSIDNAESRDLDQVEWAEPLTGGRIRVLVGIADVDAVVGGNSATDAHARANATSVYTGGPVFPMLPERLSTDVTSLGEGAERRALIMEFVVGPGGEVDCADVGAATVRNKARLNYDQVADWLENRASQGPAAISSKFKVQSSELENRASQGPAPCAISSKFKVQSSKLENRASQGPCAISSKFEVQSSKLENGPSQGPAMPAGLGEQLLLQQEAAERLKALRKEHGSVTLGGVESVPIVVNNNVSGFAFERENPARDIIENFMVAANVAMAGFLRARNAPCLRRVVRTPKRWDRIQALAAAAGAKLPDAPDSGALNEFLAQRREADPDHFPELSLAVVKALGPGVYVVEHPGAEHEGHFGLAVGDYTHSTAPNRRYADLVMQRLLKASIAGKPGPYSESALSDLAAHCTEREAAARHVERFMKKVAAALMLGPQVGRVFDAIVTSVSPKGTFARLLTVPAEGRVIRGERGLDVGERMRARLAGVDAGKGFIDLETAR